MALVEVHTEQPRNDRYVSVNGQRDTHWKCATRAYLDHEELVLDDAVVREAAHRGDRLLCRVGLGGGVVRVDVDAAADLRVNGNTRYTRKYGYVDQI